MIQDLMERFEEHPKLSCGIVFIDEADKLAARGGETRMEYSRGTQHSLLKLVEGSEVTWDDITLSTEKLLFIFGGAFSGLTANRDAPQRKNIGFLRQEPMETNIKHALTVSDFIRYGMEPELMGRVGQCIPLDALDREALKKILLGSDLSPLKKYQEFFRGYGIQLEFSNKRLEELVAGALERGSGARGLNSLVEEAVEPLLFKLASGDIQKRALVDGRRDKYAG
jgi:ATP-dependent Clp protease ATP-binding subunit ClpX